MGWDWLDLEMIAQYRQLHDELCPGCGRPLAMHETDSPDEYSTGWLECTAETAIARARDKWEKTAEGQKAEKTGRARRMRWTAWLTEDGRPEWTME